MLWEASVNTEQGERGWGSAAKTPSWVQLMGGGTPAQPLHKASRPTPTTLAPVCLHGGWTGGDGEDPFLLTAPRPPFFLHWELEDTC